MKINPKDYDSSSARRAALDEMFEHGKELPQYLNRVEYDLERGCMSRDYFLGVTIYRDEGDIREDYGYEETNFSTYDSEMPDPLFPINSVRKVVGVGVSPNTGLEYTPGGTLTSQLTITDQSTGSHASAVYEDGAAIVAQLYFQADFQGNTESIPTTQTLTSNAVSAFDLNIPSDINTTHTHLSITVNENPRNAMFIANGDQSAALFNTVFDRSTLTAPTTPQFGYYPDADGPNTVMTITLPFKQGITPSDYSATVTVVERVSNSQGAANSSTRRHLEQSQTAFTGNSIAFTKNEVLNGESGSITHPLEIIISDLALA